MSRVVLYPYKMASASVNALADSLREKGINVLKVYPDRNYKPKKGDTLVNWGFGRDPEWDSTSVRWVNSPRSVEVAGNKATAFHHLIDNGVPTPEVTTDRNQAQRWVDSGKVAVVRELLRGHSGAGIKLVGASIVDGDNTGVVPEAPLYTKYFKKAREYRIHVFMGTVIFWQQKMIRRDFTKEQVNYQIRNHSNGWIYAHESAVPPNTRCIQVAINAVAALGLEFGAVDVIYNEKERTALCLEVNTAPGLEGTTVTKYSSAIEALL